jgi:trans-aconitate methyltransferase
MATTEHRVAAHLGLAASDYDAQIRRYTPRYDEMIDTVVAIIAALPAPFVIDLGAGTGALGGAILDRVPQARVRFLDIDPAMLDVAGARVAGHGARAELWRGSFDDALPACDAVVASLALHHVPERDRKRALYARIEERLAGAGAVVISSCARDQLAYDCHPAVNRPNGVFTAAVIEVLDEHVRTAAPLSVLQLFQEAKDKLRNGQLPTLYVNGLTDDFPILERVRPGVPGDGIVAVSAEVPAALSHELHTFLHSLVQIRRRRRVGLVRATRQLERLAAEFYRYGDDAFVVPGHDANVVEAFDNARTCIVGCTTPAYVDEWRRGGAGLLATNRDLVARHGGRVVRFFFVPDDFESRVPGVLAVVRDHLAAGVLAVVVNVDSFSPVVLQEVFKESRPSDLSSLECAFVDGRIFLKTHFVANGDPRIELDQRPARCRHEYKTQLRPFLVAGGALFGASLRDGGGDGVALYPLQLVDVDELRDQLDADLGAAARFTARRSSSFLIVRRRPGSGRAQHEYRQARGAQQAVGDRSDQGAGEAGAPVRRDADHVDPEPRRALRDRSGGIVSAHDVGVDGLAGDGGGERLELSDQRGLVDLVVVLDDMQHVDLAGRRRERERVGHGAVGELRQVGGDHRALQHRDGLGDHHRLGWDAHHRLGGVLDDHRRHRAEPTQPGLLAGADDDRVDLLVARQLDHVVADPAQAAEGARADLAGDRQRGAAEPAEQVALDQPLDLRIGLDQRARGQAVVRRGVVGVVDRAEHDVDRAALAERQRPLDAEVAGRRVVDAEQDLERSRAARERDPRRRIADDDHRDVGQRDHLGGGRPEPGQALGARLRRDDQQVAGLALGDADQGLLDRPGQQLGANGRPRRGPARAGLDVQPRL